jgi:tRNA threonylcarbamoyl adenosine modification protein (Sua5/YciO/YrdC/YwlC family)
MLVRIHPDDPQPRLIKQVADCLRNGGVIIYPTDTIYGLGCDIFHTEAVTRICRIKGIDPKKSHFSFVCSGLEHLGDYTKSVDKSIFRLLKASLPGPYTFILEASRQVPKMLKAKRDTVGIRVPDNNICRMLVEELEHPIMSTSLPMDGDVEYYTDPELMEEQFGKLVDMVIDGGHGGIIPSTVIDCTDGAPELIRAGAGVFEP